MLMNLLPLKNILKNWKEKERAGVSSSNIPITMEIYAEESLTLEKYIKELEREEKSWCIIQQHPYYHGDICRGIAYP